MSVLFSFWADQVTVVRRGPGDRAREWPARMLDRGDHALIEVGTDVQPGDEITKPDFFGRPGPVRVVAEVDWDRQSQHKRGVITWAGPSRMRQNQKEARVTLDLQYHGMRLLDWLYDRAGDDPGYEDVHQFVTEYDLPSGSADLLVNALERKGVIDPVRTFGALEAQLTASGIEFVQQVRAERADPSRRTRELQRRMLCWLERWNVPPPDWSDFLAGENGHFNGASFTLAELEREAEYLHAKNLISGRDIDQAGDGTVKPALTMAGRDCVLDYGGNVSDYLNRAHGPTTTNITMTGSTGNIVVASENVVQNLRTGLDTRKLLEFAGFVRQVLPTLGLTDDQQDVVDSEAAELHTAATATTPDRRRLRRLLNAVLDGLRKAAPSVAQATAIAMGNDAIKALTGQ